MKIKTALALLTCGAATAFAAVAGEIENLWPEGRIPDFQPHQIALPTNMLKSESFRAGERHMPYLEWCQPPAASNRLDVCMILISGGGYSNWCDIGLVDDWRRRFTELGVQCVKLVYRTPRPKGLPYYASAWADGQRAVRIVRSEAAKRGYDPEKIGAVSMSAGSHLAVLLSTSSLTPAYEPIDELDKLPCHLNWALPNAIAYGLTDGLGVPNSTGGNGPDVKLDACFKFDAKTCPMCMTHGGKDPYSPISSTFVYRRLRQMKIPAEVHIYPDRGHGAYGLERQIEFMRQMGYFGQLAPEEELDKRLADDTDGVTYAKSDLWPEGKMPDAQDHQCKPYLEWYIPKQLKTKAIQII